MKGFCEDLLMLSAIPAIMTALALLMSCSSGHHVDDRPPYRAHRSLHDRDFFQSAEGLTMAVIRELA